MDYTSYAIWWVPRPATGLGQFGAEWTGWCADRGTVSQERAAVLPPRRGVPGLVGRHGLHASIRAAFRLAPGHSSWALEDALAELAERTEPLRLPPIELTVFDGRVALALARPDPALARLLADVEATLRPFRQPLPYARSQGVAEPGGAAGSRRLARPLPPAADRPARPRHRLRDRRRARAAARRGSGAPPACRRPRACRRSGRGPALATAAALRPDRRSGRRPRPGARRNGLARAQPAGPARPRRPLPPRQRLVT